MRTNYYVEFHGPLVGKECAYFETFAAAAIFAEAISKVVNASTKETVDVILEENKEILISYFNGKLLDEEDDRQEYPQEHPYEE